MSLSPSNPLYMDPDVCSPDACSCKNDLNHCPFLDDLEVRCFRPSNLSYVANDRAVSKFLDDSAI